jgi:hypothetical protein
MGRYRYAVPNRDTAESPDVEKCSKRYVVTYLNLPWADNDEGPLSLQPVSTVFKAQLQICAVISPAN